MKRTIHHSLFTIHHSSLQTGFIKLTKKTLILSLTLLITLPSLTSLILLFPKKAQAAWADDDWGYRKGEQI